MFEARHVPICSPITNINCSIHCHCCTLPSLNLKVQRSTCTIWQRNSTQRIAIATDSHHRNCELHVASASKTGYQVGLLKAVKCMLPDLHYNGNQQHFMRRTTTNRAKLTVTTIRSIISNISIRKKQQHPTTKLTAMRKERRLHTRAATAQLLNNTHQ